MPTCVWACLGGDGIGDVGGSGGYSLASIGGVGGVGDIGVGVMGDGGVGVLRCGHRRMDACSCTEATYRLPPTIYHPPPRHAYTHLRIVNLCYELIVSRQLCGASSTTLLIIYAKGSYAALFYKIAGKSYI